MTQPKQILQGAFCARQQDHVRLVQICHTVYIPQRYIFVPFKRRKIRKIGDARQTDHHNIHQFPGGFAFQSFTEAILVINIHMGIGDHPCHWYTAQHLQAIQPRLQNGTVPPELIDDGPLDSLPFLRLQKRHRSVQLRKNTAPVDISYQQHRCIHQPGQPHIDDIPLFEVDLCRAASALDNDDVVLLVQALVCLQNRREVFLLFSEIFRSPHIALHFSIYDHLTAHVRCRFQQDRVHTDIRFDAGRFCLHHLGTAHFSTVLRNKRVEGHILAFEGRHPIAILFENAAQTGAQQAFACIGHRALDHNVFCHDDSFPSVCSMAWSRRWFSAWRRTAMRYHPGPSPG